MSDGLIQQLTQVAGWQVTNAQLVTDLDDGITELSKLVPPLGTAVGLVEGICNLISPSAGGPSIQDLQNQIASFESAVSEGLNELGKQVAGGQLDDNARAIEIVLTQGPMAVFPEILDWRNSPGLPLPASSNPGQYQITAREALETLLGVMNSTPPDTPPTGYWWLPAGDLPLFAPQTALTYIGTTKMFNVPDTQTGGDLNPYTDPAPATGAPALFDLSVFSFTNDFLPSAVAGVPADTAFNPTWVLPQSMAAVYYYLLICGAVIANFPNDGSTNYDLVGGNNFAGALKWYHDQIRAGIVNIRPPYALDLIPTDSNGKIPASADAGNSQWNIPCATFQIIAYPGNSVSGQPFSEWKRPYGALCNYTGYVANIGGKQPSVDQYPDYVFPTPGESVTSPEGIMPSNPGHEWYNGFYGKYLVASLWRAKMVYLGIGLKRTWNTINTLYRVGGKPQLPGVCFGDWSLKELFQMLGAANTFTASPLPLQNLSADQIGRLSGNSLVSSTLLFYSGNNVGCRATVRSIFTFLNGAAPQPAKPSSSLRALLQT